MIEIHAHVLPGLDDGAASRSEAESLLTAYARQGVTDLVCTCHMGAERLQTLQQGSGYPALYRDHLDSLQRWLDDQGLALRLHSGHELVLLPDLLQCLRTQRQLVRELLTLAGSAYLLVELPPWLSGGLASLERLLFGLRLEGYEPVLAHPERIVAFAEVLPVLRQWVLQEQIFLQVNASALVRPDQTARQDRYQRRRAHADQLISQGLVYFAASDAHSMAKRPPQHDRLYQVLCRDYGRAAADRLLLENPRAVLEDRPVRPVLPGQAPPDDHT